VNQGQQPATFGFKGGLDTSSPALAVPAGALLYGLNYEPLAEGYGRVAGYERYDGQAAPSAAPWWHLDFVTGISEITEGDVVTGATSGATGTVLTAPAGLTGTWGADAAGSLALVDVTGTFIDGESLTVGGTPSATTDGTATENDAPTDALVTAWAEAAMALQRTAITKPAGSGPTRGVAVHNGTVYAWRDNAGGTALVGHKATASGWQALGTSSRIAFTSGGTTPIAEGDTITGATSAATAAVVRVVVTSGDWAAGNAAGWLHVTTIVGAFTAENVNVGASLNLATIVAAVANTFAPGGRVRWLSHNFYGASNYYRLYAATGETYGFELVGDYMVPMFTGMVDDKPQRVFEIANHLGLTFAGGSVQVSATGEPLNWTAILGAGEIGLGTDVTDVVQANETAVAIFGQQKIAVLTGHDETDFLLDTLTEEAGALEDTAQRIARTVYVDRRGLRDLTATQAFGNFKAGALSARFEKHFKDKFRGGALPVGSLVSRTKSQYRLYWSDATGLAVYMGGKEAEAIPFDLGFTPYCFGQGELADGEGLFIGADDGWVYRMDSGNNYDGAQISAACLTGFNHLGSNMVEKRWHKATLELRGPLAGAHRDHRPVRLWRPVAADRHGQRVLCARRRRLLGSSLLEHVLVVRSRRRHGRVLHRRDGPQRQLHFLDDRRAD
jgi:hypothetical protein